MNRTVDLRRYVPWAVGKPNRPDPAQVIAPPPALRDDLPDLTILTDRQRGRLYEASLQSPALYRFTHEIERHAS